MRITTRTAREVVSLLLLTLSGCASLGRDTTVLEQYVLGEAAAADPVPASTSSGGLTLGLRRLDLAPYLASPAIVVRRGSHQIVVSEFHRWGESPSDGITRTLAGHLAVAPGIRAVDVAPWAPGSEHDYLIQLHVSRFEGVASAEPQATEGEARVTAAWEILGGPDGAVLARGSTDFREGGWRVGDYGGLVTLLHEGVSTLAGDLVTCVSGLASAAENVLLCPPTVISTPLPPRVGILEVTSRRPIPSMIRSSR